MNNNKVKKIKFSDLYVSQLYISSEKLNSVKGWLTAETLSSLEPLPVYKFGRKYTLTDGHTRALVAFLLGAETISVYIDDDDIVTSSEGLSLYKTCINWCNEANVITVPDLANRIIPENEYQIKWIGRCEGIR